MTEKSILRAGAVLLISSNILNILFNAVQPPINDYANTLEVFTAISGVPLWRVSRVGILLAGLLGMGGMLAFTYSQRKGNGKFPALLASAVVVIGTGILIVMMAMDLAQHEMARYLLAAQPDEFEPVFWASQALHSASFMIFTILLLASVGGTPFLLGLTIFYGEEYPKWLGWLSMVGGVGMVATATTQAIGGPTLLLMNGLVPFFALITTISGILLGVFMVREARPE